MKVGDLVVRKVNVVSWKSARRNRLRHGVGIVVSKQMAGTPLHPCITVLYPRTNQRWDIAEALMEVVSESR